MITIASDVLLTFNDYFAATLVLFEAKMADKSTYLYSALLDLDPKYTVVYVYAYVT